jgi:5'-3' exonuclease
MLDVTDVANLPITDLRGAEEMSFDFQLGTPFKPYQHVARC